MVAEGGTNWQWMRINVRQFLLTFIHVTQEALR